MRQSTSDEYAVVELSIATPGGDCRHSLQRSFEVFFKEAGIHSGPFRWGKDYFPAEIEDSMTQAAAYNSDINSQEYGR